jgi:hypothetical protein
MGHLRYLEAGMEAGKRGVKKVNKWVPIDLFG